PLLALLALSHRTGQLRHDALQPQGRRGLHQSVRPGRHRAPRRLDRPSSRQAMTGAPKDKPSGPSPAPSSHKPEGKMWGGRFERGPDEIFYEFQRSFKFDRRLLPYEVAVDRAWAKALAGVEILTAGEALETLAALDQIAERAASDAAWLEASEAEDVHHFVELALVEKLGVLGHKLHTGHSRNALVATDFRLHIKTASTEMHASTGRLTAALLSTSLSRLAEDFILVATPEFGFITLPDEYSTGSSLMPQKKNPDAWELIRGKTGRITAALFSLLTTLKGLPTGYQRDLQEDKEPVFAAHDQALAMVGVAGGAVAATQINVARLREAASGPALLATEAADYLVRRGVPFRQAHEIVGKIVREGERRGEPWTALPLAKLKTFSPLFEDDLRAALTVEASLAARSVPGGTAPDRVRAALADYRARLKTLREKGRAEAAATLEAAS